jgi:predicted ABC-type ATPase
MVTGIVGEGRVGRRTASWVGGGILGCVGLAEALTSLARVRRRVARGGHDVPSQIILRRYARSLANLPAAIKFANRTFILDNTGARHRLLVTIDRGQIRHRSSRMPEWAMAAVAETAKPM